MITGETPPCRDQAVDEGKLRLNGWPLVPLSEMGEVLCGQSPPTSTVNQERRGIPYISGPEQWDGQSVHLSKWTTSPKRVVPSGCVFITVKGAGVGTVFPGVEAAIGRDIYAFKPASHVLAKYLEHALRFTAGEIVRSARGDIPGLSKHHLTTHKIVLPPLDEQNRIVAEIEKQFTRLDAGVASLKRVQTALKRYRASILKSACEGRLVPTEAELARKENRGYETGEQLLQRILKERREKWNGKGKYKEPVSANIVDLPQMPEGWVWTRLGQLGFTFGGLTKNPKRSKLRKQLPYLRVANVYANELRLADVEYIGVEESELAKLLVRTGDLLIVEGNGSKSQIGRLAIWNGAIDPCVHQNHLIKIRPIERQMSAWILYWLLSPPGRHFVENVASSTSGLYTLSVNKVGDLPIPLPPFDEQKRILMELERQLSISDDLTAAVGTAVARGDNLRVAILQGSFIPV
jgi:type I restriction enzyme, S subunit